jgi:hypothetical protein
MGWGIKSDSYFGNRLKGILLISVLVLGCLPLFMQEVAPHQALAATIPTIITSPGPTDTVTTETPTITGTTDPKNDAVNVYWDYCDDGCRQFLGTAAVDHTTGAWTFTPTPGFHRCGGATQTVFAVGVVGGKEIEF